MEYNKIAFFDVETTGTDTNNDCIVQIAVFLCDMDFNRITDTIQCLVNPQIPIPQKSTDVHGITDAMVASSPTFDKVAPGLYQMIKDCHIAGYNVKFDILMLMAELQRCGIIYDVSDKMVLDPYVTLIKKEPRDQSSVYRYFTNKELEGAHDAAADINATHEILIAQRAKYGLNTAEEIYKVSEPENQCDLSGKIKMLDGVPVFNFGKHYEKPISDEINYLNWMLTADMPADTKKWIENYLNKSQNGS